ncbi:MAG: CoA transferase [Deltaproteobacteria bacterium]|nr:CoA transferase [Deltaproteobacteria bacterium]
MKPRPLEGIRVVECGVYHAGPGGTAILGDLGAEVIKVEAPGQGDPIRTLMRVGSIPFEIAGKRSLFCEGANRSKKSVTLNLKAEKGREILYKLIQKADVFMTNMRMKALEELKITYPILKEHNSKLIYASVSAFGRKGPEKDNGGFDYQGQAKSGMMYAAGEPGAPPLTFQFGLADQVTAIMTSHQILTALLMRERTGIGQEVHVSILSASMFLNYFNILIPQLAGFEVPRHKRSVEHPMRNYYQCKDGKWLMITLTPPARHWGPLCRALGRPDLENDPRFETDDKRFENAELLVSILDGIFAEKPRQAWLEEFPTYDLFCCAVNSNEEVGSDPQVLANDYLTDLDHPTLGRVKFPGYPVHFSESRAGTTRAAPDLGEHTEEVLTEIAGFSREEVAGLREEGVI